MKLLIEQSLYDLAQWLYQQKAGSAIEVDTLSGVSDSVREHLQCLAIGSSVEAASQALADDATVKRIAALVVAGMSSAELSVNLNPGQKVDLNPNQKVDLNPGQKVDLNLNQKVDLNLGQKVDLNPNQKVDLNPGQKVDLNPNQKVDLRPDQKVNLNPNQKVDLNQHQKVDLNPNQKVDLNPGQKVDLNPNQKVELSPDQKVNLNPNQKVDLNQHQKVDLNPKQTVDLNPGQAVRLDPGQKVDLSDEGKRDLSDRYKIGLEAVEALSNQHSEEIRGLCVQKFDGVAQKYLNACERINTLCVTNAKEWLLRVSEIAAQDAQISIKWADLNDVLRTMENASAALSKGYETHARYVAEMATVYASHTLMAELADKVAKIAAVQDSLSDLYAKIAASVNASTVASVAAAAQDATAAMVNIKSLTQKEGSKW